MLTVGEAAKLLGLTPKAIRRFIRQGRLPAIKAPGPNGSMYRMALEDLQKLSMELPVSLVQSPAEEAAAAAEAVVPFEQADPGEAIPAASGHLLPDPASAMVTLPVETWERQMEIYNQSMVTIGQLQGQMELLNKELDKKTEELRERGREIQKMQHSLGQNQLGQAVIPVLEEHGEHLQSILMALQEQEVKQDEFAQKTLNQLAKGEAQQLELSKEILTKMERRDRELNQIIRTWREERETRTEVKSSWWSRLWKGRTKDDKNKPNRRAKAMT